jgi:hypothetical protein
MGKRLKAKEANMTRAATRFEWAKGDPRFWQGARIGFVSALVAFCFAALIFGSILCR